MKLAHLLDRISVHRQLLNWVFGCPMHNKRRDECCPDFSCCNKKVHTSFTTRWHFLLAGPGERAGMLGGFLGQSIASAFGGEVEETAMLDDGSGFSVASFPLRTDHWIYQPTGEPPMPFRVGIGESRDVLAKKITEAAKYAVRASTMNGERDDFDPDAMVQNFIVGMLGYWTEDGLPHLDDF